jgi:diguanylate cyclase
MWFGRSARDKPDPDPVQLEAAPEPQVDGDRALDTVAALLRAAGRFAFDLEGLDRAGVAQACEEWALHILVGAPRPGGVRTARRDFVGLRAWFLERRKSEVAAVEQALSDLRQAIWAFLRTTAGALADSGEADGQVAGHLARLRSVVEASSPAEIKREVLSAAAAIGDVLAGREQRQRARVAELGADLHHLGRQLEEARREGSLDPLTRLYNRGALDQHLCRTTDMGTLFSSRACLLMIDVDHFKRVNDGAGHQAGDEVLRQLSDCLARTLLRKTDFLARYGGEEMVAVLGGTTLDEGVMLAERLRAAVERLAVPHGGGALRVTISIGVAALESGDTPERWLARADQALYQAKEGGRNRVVRA